MNRYFLRASHLNGEIAIPPSKSHTLRALLFGSLGNGETVIQNYLDSPDTHAMIEACRLFGASVAVSPNQIVLQGLSGVISHTEDVIHAGNSGIVLRFCSALGALSPQPVVVTGDYSIRHLRPMEQLLSGLSQLGVSAATMRGDQFAPVIVRGPITGKKVEISGEDSQPVSALLIAAAFAAHPIEIHVRNPGEKPWIAMTLDWFDRLGIKYTHEGFERYEIQGNSNYKGFKYRVPGDLSSAAFPIAAALVTGSEINLKNIDLTDNQGDKELIALFKKMGASIEVNHNNRTLHVNKCNSLVGVTVDINNFIDSISILAVVACYAEGETRIYNASIAKQKECNRIRSMCLELKKMGADIEETEDGLIIRKSLLNGGQLFSHHDHRTAMSLAVAGLGASGETTVSDISCISKTFPNFLNDFKALGAAIESV